MFGDCIEFFSYQANNCKSLQCPTAWPRGSPSCSIIFEGVDVNLCVTATVLQFLLIYHNQSPYFQQLGQAGIQLQKKAASILSLFYLCFDTPVSGPRCPPLPGPPLCKFIAVSCSVSLFSQSDCINRIFLSRYVCVCCQHPCIRNTLSSAAQTHKHSSVNTFCFSLCSLTLSSSALLQSMLIMHSQVYIYIHTHTGTHSRTHTDRHTPPDCLAYSRHSLIVLRESQGQQVPSLIDSTERGRKMNKVRNAYTDITLRTTQRYKHILDTHICRGALLSPGCSPIQTKGTYMHGNKISIYRTADFCLVQ